LEIVVARFVSCSIDVNGFRSIDRLAEGKIPGSKMHFHFGPVLWDDADSKNKISMGEHYALDLREFKKRKRY
jgi:hypothetical protein